MYPFKREPESSESKFSIKQHEAIEEIMNLKDDNKREDSLKLSLSWVKKSNIYPQLNEERSSLEGLSKLYSFIAVDLMVLEKHEESLPFYQKSIEAMVQCCEKSFSQLYCQELAAAHFQYASQLEFLNQKEKALLEAQKSLQIFNSLIERPFYELDISIEDDKRVVEEFIAELIY